MYLWRGKKKQFRGNLTFYFTSFKDFYNFSYCLASLTTFYVIWNPHDGEMGKPLISTCKVFKY